MNCYSGGLEAENDQYDISYEYLEARTEGELSFTSPDQPGEYDFRMHNTDSSDGQEVASISFVVAVIPEKSETFSGITTPPGEDECSGKGR